MPPSGWTTGSFGALSGLPLNSLGQDGGLAVVLVADDAAGAVLAGDLAALAVEGVAVGVAGGVPHDAHVAVVLEPAELDVVGDVGPDEVLADAVPGRPLGPEHAGMEAPDRGVADLDLGEARVEDEDVGVGVAGGFGVGPVVSRRRGDGGRVWALAVVQAAQDAAQRRRRPRGTCDDR